MNNAEWCTKHGIKYKRLTGYTSGDVQFVSIGYYDKGTKYHELYRGKPVSALLTECIIAWLDMPYIEPILDDVEKSYLAAVIKPFRNQVKYIWKIPDKPYEYISINLKKHAVELPNFMAGKMYKGMKAWKKYSLEELGL